MVAKTIEVGIDIDVNYKSIEDLELEIQKLEEEFKTLSIGDEKWKELGNQIKRTRSQLKDFDLQFEGLDREQRATALVDTFAGLTDVIAGAAAGLSLMGVESDTLKKVEQNFGAVLLVTQGVRGGLEAIVKGQQLWGEYGDTIKSSLVGAFTSATGAINKTKIALTGLGIGAVIAGIGYLVSTFDEWKTVLGFTNTELEFTADEFKTIGTESAKLIVEVERLTSAVTDQTLSEKDRQKALDDLQAKYPNYFTNLGNDINNTNALTNAKERLIDSIIKEATVKAATKKIEEATAKNIETQISLTAEQEANTRRIQELNSKGTKRTIGDGVELANLRKRQIQITTELDASEQSQTETVTRLNNIIKENTEAIQTNGGAVTTTTETKKVATKVTKQLSEAEKQAAKDAEEAARKRVAAIEASLATENELWLRTLSERDRAIAEAQQSYEDRLGQAAEQFGIDSQEYKNVVELLRQDIVAINKDYDQQEIDAAKEAADKKAEIDKEAAEKKIKTEEEVAAATKAINDQAYNDTIAILGNIGGLFEQGSKAQKAFALTQIAADTARALTGALGNANSPTPDNIATGGLAGIAKYITLAATITANAARAKQILQSGGTTTIAAPATSGGAASSIPQFQFGGTTQTTRQPQTQNLTQTAEAMPIKAYVLAGDVDSAQQANAKIRKVRKL